MIGETQGLEPAPELLRSLEKERNITVQENQSYWKGSFFALSSPCEVLTRVSAKKDAYSLTQLAAREAWRIEAKYSRYRQDGWLAHLHKGVRCFLDEETIRLVNFGKMLYKATDGCFDLTSGILRKAWKFGSDGNKAQPDLVRELLQYVGWDKVDYNPPEIQLPPSMQLDFGGIGKEYAVDSALLKISEVFEGDVLVNFGGDMACRETAHAWNVGIDGSDRRIEFYAGGLATSGTTQRFIQHNKSRYSHILNARTGYPLAHTPHSITVQSDSCCAAGAATTIAMTKGPEAEKWLAEATSRYWID